MSGKIICYLVNTCFSCCSRKVIIIEIEKERKAEKLGKEIAANKKHEAIDRSRAFFIDSNHS